MVRYSPLAHRTAVLFGAGPDADDVVQEAFVKAFRSLHRLREDGSFRAWLLSIVVNETSNLRRAARRRSNLAVRLALQPEKVVPVPEAAVVDGERRARLLAAVEQLSERDRAVVTCRYLLELSEAETVQALGWPAGTVKSTLSRALRRLQARLDAEPAGTVGVTRGYLDRAGLEAELRELGRRLDLPPAGQYAPVVLARLAAPDGDGPPAPAPWWRSVLDRRRRVRRTAAAAVLAGLGVLVVSPAGQAAVARVLRVAGVVLDLGASADGSVQPPRRPEVLPGETAGTLAEARRRASFPVTVPQLLGDPDQVTVSDAGRVVSPVYRAAPRPARTRAGRGRRPGRRVRRHAGRRVPQAGPDGRVRRPRRRRVRGLDRAAAPGHLPRRGRDAAHRVGPPGRADPDLGGGRGRLPAGGRVQPLRGAGRRPQHAPRGDRRPRRVPGDGLTFPQVMNFNFFT